jgi:hypothetical protein
VSFLVTDAVIRQLQNNVVQSIVVVRKAAFFIFYVIFVNDAKLHTFCHVAKYFSVCREKSVFLHSQKSILWHNLK